MINVDTNESENGVKCQCRIPREAGTEVIEGVEVRMYKCPRCGFTTYHPKDLQRAIEKKRVFRTMAEIKREFFPNTYKKKLEEEEKKPGAFGTGLAKEIMEEIRRKLREESKNE